MLTGGDCCLNVYFECFIWTVRILLDFSHSLLCLLVPSQESCPATDLTVRLCCLDSPRLVSWVGHTLDETVVRYLDWAELMLNINFLKSFAQSLSSGVTVQVACCSGVDSWIPKCLHASTFYLGHHSVGGRTLFRCWTFSILLCAHFWLVLCSHHMLAFCLLVTETMSSNSIVEALHKVMRLQHTQ